MQPGRTPTTSAEPPGIDELSERLSALATRIDTLNGGRRPARAPGAKPAAQKPATLMKSLVAAQPEAKAAATPAPRREPAPPPARAERDPDGRLWPRAPVPNDPRIMELQARIVEQDALLHDRDRRIADLSSLRDQQAHELQRAREQVASNAVTLGSLHELAQTRDGEVAELTRRLLESESEKVALESKLATALRDANHSMVRLVTSQSALNDQSTDLAESRSLIDELRTQLSAALTANAVQMGQAEQRAQRRYDAELRSHIDNNERRLAELQALIKERDQRVADLEADKAALTQSSETLSSLLSATRAELDAAIETVAAKDRHIDFLDTVIKVARENAEATVRELVAEFDRERAEYAAKAQAASALQQDIVRLLPRLLERRGHNTETASAA
jgi:chromosome segregation ATPase